MKPIIMDMKGMSDSTEVYESRPNPFFVYFIYGILGILFIILIWMYFSKLDIVVKSNGLFKFEDQIYDVSSSITGKVLENRINDGQFVNKGDILMSLSVDSLNETVKNYQSLLEDVQQRLEVLKAYDESLHQDRTVLDRLAGNKYYSEFLNRRDLLSANLKSTEGNTEGQKIQYQKNIETIQESVHTYESQTEKLKQVIECIKTRTNQFDTSQSYYNSTVNSYLSNYNVTEVQYDNQLKEYRAALESLQDQIDEQIKKQNVAIAGIAANSDNVAENAGTAVETLVKNLEATKNELAKTESEKNKVLNNLELQQITSVEQQIETIKNTILTLNSNITTARAQMETLSGTDTETSESITILTERSTVAAEILSYENKKTECENTLKSYDLQNGNCNIVANASGYLSVSQEVKQGAFIQEGTRVCQILPEQVSSYYAEIYVENSDIAKLKVGQKVKFEISAYPSSEYGYFTGVIETISKDIKVDENSGSAFYLVKVQCDKNTVTNKNGKSGSIMNGLACQAKVIVDEQSVLRYLFMKINLLD